MGFTLERFTAGAAALFRRYLLLGFALIAVYGVSASVYGVIVFVGYRNIAGRGPLIGWTLAAALLAVVLIVWTMAVNLVYVIMQLVVAANGGSVAGAAKTAIRFLRADGRQVIRIFVAVLLLVILVTGLSLVATAGLGLIAFVPLAGLAVLPLQLVAWLLRNLVFQFLGLTALSAYLTRFRYFSASLDGPLVPPADGADPSSS